MSFLLDTNICSAHMRRPGGLAHRFIQYSGRLNIPSIVLGELYAGAYMLDNPASLLSLVADLLQDVKVLPFDDDCAEEFGKLRGILHAKGIAVSPLDLQIAAFASVHALTLVTNNTKCPPRRTQRINSAWAVGLSDMRLEIKTPSKPSHAHEPLAISGHSRNRTIIISFAPSSRRGSSFNRVAHSSD